MQKLNLYTTSKIFEIPPVFASNYKIGKNKIVHLLKESEKKEVIIEEYHKNSTSGYVFTRKDNDEELLVITNHSNEVHNFSKIISLDNFNLDDHEELTLNVSKAKWINYKNILINCADSNIDQPDLVLKSWENTFKYIGENVEHNIVGLREPQLGGVHALHSHWAVCDGPATVVMPTGTGKTETMLSVLVSKPCNRLLVVVPTDALRTQISLKFINLGLLKKYGIISEEAQYPVVGIIYSKFHDIAEVESFFSKCNVIVSTINIVGQSDWDIQKRIAEYCPYLFIDEAHHVAAQTWNSFKQKFKSRIVQFTATPFREDGKSIDGKIVFNYPLHKAQRDGYFRSIHFDPVKEYDHIKGDIEIAKKAVNHLKKDFNKGHIVMARVATTERAEQVFKIYQKYKEYNPVRIHSKMNKSDIKICKNDIFSGKSRIIICVDMLGEGFDLPELKIAAFHDIRKSLPITLQLAGRFTRNKPYLGDATFIANIADVEVKDELRKLYSNDPDWNYILPEASTASINNEIELQDFIDGFSDLPKDISLQNIRPKSSTVVYKTKCKKWDPDNYKKGFVGIEKCEYVKHSINSFQNTLVIVTAKKIKVEWAKNNDLYTMAWELNILFWSEEQNLLYIHGSNNNGFYYELAKATSGDDVEQIKGADVFRCFYGLNRLKLQNVGLLEVLGRLIRYTMRSGSDIEPALTYAQKRNTHKSNIFGIGYEGGKKNTIGCSNKGRIWARQAVNLAEYVKWCKSLGLKLQNNLIDPDEILKGTLVAEEIDSRPPFMPITIDWPDLIYKYPETNIVFIVNEKKEIPIYLTDIVLDNPKETGNITFSIKSDSFNFGFELKISKHLEISHFSFNQISGNNINVQVGNSIFLLSEFFNDNPPVIWFVNGSSLQGNELIKLKKVQLPFPKEKIEAWNWVNIDITKESQGINKIKDSIQYKVICELLKRDYGIIYDDDGPGEIADVVGIKDFKNKIFIELFHCKFSVDSKPGARVKDLYEVCGQAQKSISWIEKQPHEFINHLLRRDQPRKQSKLLSGRFERGNKEDLFGILEKARYLPFDFKINIVQPGLSKDKVTTQQLELLSVTENYLMETLRIPFGVIASE